MSVTATTTPATSTPPKTKDQNTAPPDPRRRMKEPNIAHIDAIFGDGADRLTAFVMPRAIDKTWCDLAVAIGRDAETAIQRGYDKIADDSAQAYKAVVDEFHAEWDDTLSRLDEKSRATFLKDVQGKADASSRAAQETSEKEQAAAMELLESKIGEQLNVASNLLKIYPTPAALLTGTTIGPEHDAEIERYSRRLQNCDYVVMRTWCAKALAGGNRSLQAAVCERLASMDRPPLTARDFASRVVGSEHDRLRLAEQELRNIKDNLANRRIAAMRRRTSLVSALELGLRKLATDKLRAEVDAQDEE